MIHVQQLSKVYKNGVVALSDVNLSIKKGEIFALLGPNGAGKTTLISIINGIVNASSGSVKIAGLDTVDAYRYVRQRVGLVPQELTLGAFETVWNTVCFSRGLFNKPQDPTYVEKLLRDLSLWDKKDKQLRTLSGGMKRRVLIAKALSHEPDVLFLDEPSAGVDVELRQSMWEVIRQLQKKGVTIILTTHYLEEAEAMADRVGIIDQGQLKLVEEKATLLKKLGKKQLHIQLKSPLTQLPNTLAQYNVALDDSGCHLIYRYQIQEKNSTLPRFMRELQQLEVDIYDIQSTQSSLEEIFIDLIGHNKTP